MSYLKRHGTRRVPQSVALPGKEPNSRRRLHVGGRRWTRLRRFLVLGSEGGTLLRDRARADRRERRAVEGACATTACARSARSSRSAPEGRAPKNDPALFALAIAAGMGDEATRKAALEALPKVGRTGTHLFQLRDVRRGLPRLGPRAPRASPLVRGQPVEALAYQVVKYRQRDGWSAP